MPPTGPNTAPMCARGGQDVGFPLDPLWASPAIDAIGVDYYPPLSDWRDAGDHADATIASRRRPISPISAPA